LSNEANIASSHDDILTQRWQLLLLCQLKKPKFNRYVNHSMSYGRQSHIERQQLFSRVKDEILEK